jgi:hypothetical protein
MLHAGTFFLSSPSFGGTKSNSRTKAEGIKDSATTLLKAVAKKQP